MDEEKIFVCVWHNCMKCFIKGLENYLTWYYRVSENKEVVLLNEEGIENNRDNIDKIIKYTDVIIASCSCFEQTKIWEDCIKTLEKKRWYVIHKACELKPEKFRNSEMYKWLLSNKKVTHIDATYVLDLNEKVNKLKKKPRLET